MWQKSARGILKAHDVLQELMAFFIFCVMSGALGSLSWLCFAKKAEWLDKLMLGLLAGSMSIFYGLHVFGIVTAMRHSENGRLQSFFLCLKLICYLAAFILGFYLIKQSQ